MLPTAAFRPRPWPLPAVVRVLTLTAFVLLAGAAAAAWLLEPPPFRDDPNFASHPGYRAAMRLAQASQFPAAAGAFAALARRESHSSVGAWSRYQEAICLRATGRNPEAERVFKRVIRD